MAASSRTAAIEAALTYYRIKYPVKSERIEALKADYLALYEAKASGVGKTLTSSSADGVNAAWDVSLSTEEQLSALASVLARLEGRAVSAASLYARG